MAHRGARAHHVHNRDPFGDADHQVEPGIGGLEDRIGGVGRRHEDRRDGRAGLAGGLGDGVEDRHLVVAVDESLAAFAGGDAGHDPAAVIEAQLGMAGAEAAGDALDQDLGGFVYEDRHGKG
jgi:hypothetical protein